MPVLSVLITCKFDDDSIKNEGAVVFTKFSRIWVCQKFQGSRASNAEANSPI